MRRAPAENNDAATCKRFADGEIGKYAAVTTDGHAGYGEKSLGERSHDAVVQTKAEMREADCVQNASVPWREFRAPIEVLTETKPEERKSPAGRPGYDKILKFKMVVLAALYNLSDEQLEIQVRDRLSFMRFLDLGLHDPVPDATTIWLFREALVEAKLIDTLFELFDQHLAGRGFIARGGQIIDATIVSAPRQRNTREENETVKAGKTPEDWAKKPAKNQQKD